jgi:uncharacterized CHY-type Zn-finger protein
MADDQITLQCGCTTKYYSGVGWDVELCANHELHEFTPYHMDWFMARCTVCREFQTHPTHTPMSTED